MPQPSRACAGRAAIMRDPAPPGARSAEDGGRRIKVWDLLTRLFHWLLVALVAIGFVTGFMAPEWWMGLHSWAGYGVVALMLFRLVWGVFGPEYSTIGSLARASWGAWEHAKGLLLLQPRHHLGHTPLGSVMIFALAVLLIVLTVTGLLVLGGEEKQGPLAGVASYAIGAGAKEAHEALALLLLVLVGGHVLGVIVESALTRENLVGAMITGWKQLPPGVEVPQPRPARPLPAALATGALVAILALTLAYLGRLPPKGMRPLAENAAYAEECGACHDAYHPSLLPAASWAAVMAGLADHFGEDASLDPESAHGIAGWLAANAAETWDTEAANRFRTLDPAQPLRITAAPYWRWKHAEIPDAVFARTSIRTRAHCSACHRDAASGRFDDQAIAIPRE
jgi:cytochrome b